MKCEGIFAAVVFLCSSGIAFGQLYTEVSGSPYPVGDTPGETAVTPNGSYLYVNNESDNTISGFRIESDGTLSPIKKSPFTADANAVSLVTDGNFVFVANSSSNTISVFRIAVAGNLVDDVLGSPFASGGSWPNGLALTFSKEHLIVVNSSSGNFDVFAINASSGALTAATGSPFVTASGPVAAAASQVSHRFAIASSSAEIVTVYDLDPVTGIPTPVSAPPLTGLDTPTRLTFDPSESYLYSVNDGVLRGHSMAANGALNELAGSPYSQPGCSSVYDIELSTTGSRVLAIGWGSTPLLVIFWIRPDGDLEIFPSSPIVLPYSSVIVTTDPVSESVYLSNRFDDSVTAMIGPVFADGFESGDSAAWSSTVP